MTAPMTCEGFREGIAAYAAGWMEDVERAVWESHRDACPACAAEAARDGRLVALLAAVPAVAPSPVEWSELKTSVRAGRRVPAPALAAAVAALALLAGSFQLWQGRETAAPQAADTASYVRVHVNLSAAGGVADPNAAVLLTSSRTETGG